jgi:hypothetical protein
MKNNNQSGATMAKIEGALMAKREINSQCIDTNYERQQRWIREGIKVLIAKDKEGVPLAALEGRASRDIEQLADQIHRCCSDKRWTSYQKRVACDQLVKLAFLSTESMNRLAKEFPEPFREIAEELPHFPCLFPAHTEDLRTLQKIMWDEFNLGKRHTLKLHAEPGRKTFSKKTWVNALLIDLIQFVHKSAQHEDELDPGWDYGLDTFREVIYHVPLTPRNAKKWLDVIWKLLLVGIPEPEKHPQLRKLGQHPSRTERAHFGERKTSRTIKDAVGKNAKHQTAGYVRAAIKEALGKYLVRMLRKEQSDK